MRTCKTCNLNLDRSRFADNRKICKKCRFIAGNKRVRRRLLNDEIHIDVRIRMWISASMCGHKERKHLDKLKIFNLAKEALAKYPYLIFLNQDHSTGCTWIQESASIDKINPDLPYSDDNIQVIPMWLNVAKLNQPMEFLIPYLKDFSEKYQKFINHFSITEV